MDTAIAIIGTAITCALTLVGTIIWAIRLEGRVNGIEASTERCKADSDEEFRNVKAEAVQLRTKQEAMESRMVSQLQLMIEKLARIEGWLMRKKDETQQI